MKFIQRVFHNDVIGAHASPEIEMEPGFSYTVETRVTRQPRGEEGGLGMRETLYTHLSSPLSVPLGEVEEGLRIERRHGSERRQPRHGTGDMDRRDLSLYGRRRCDHSLKDNGDNGRRRRGCGRRKGGDRRST